MEDYDSKPGNSRYLQLPFKLVDGAHYKRWRTHLQDIIYSHLQQNVDLDAITSIHLIDADHFGLDDDLHLEQAEEKLKVVPAGPAVLPHRSAARAGPPVEEKAPAGPAAMEPRALRSRARAAAEGIVPVVVRVFPVAPEIVADRELEPEIPPAPARAPAASQLHADESLKRKSKASYLDYPLATAKADSCLSAALKHGKGFQTWVYKVWTLIRQGISDEIADQTAGVQFGNIPALLMEIKLAIGHIEHLDPQSLFIQFTRCSMAIEGENDLLKYTSFLGTSIRRLNAAGMESAMSQKLQMSVLIHGINQEIFNGFILHARQFPYGTYTELESALKRYALDPYILEKLNKLKPGMMKEKIFMADNPTQQRGKNFPIFDKAKAKPCYDFKNGKCSRGDACRYSHDPGAIPAPQAPLKGTRWCTFHNSHSHNTADCKALPGKTPSVHLMTEDNGIPTFDILMVARRKDKSCLLSDNKSGKCRWLLDGAASVCAARCEADLYDVVDCKIYVRGIGGGLWILRKGKYKLRCYDKTTGNYSQVVLKDVLVHASFPSNIVSEPVFLRKGCQVQKHGLSATMRSPTGEWMLEARGYADNGLLFVVECEDHIKTALPITQQLLTVSEIIEGHAAHVSSDVSPLVRKNATPEATDEASARQTLSPKENLRLLIEGHLRLHHRNFADVARALGLKLPEPAPTCFTCALAKPRLVSHDKLSARVLTRRGEGFSADFKPFSVATPEGFTCWLLLMCMWSGYRWIYLRKTQGDFVSIFKEFVAMVEAHIGDRNVIAFLLADNAKTFGSGEHGSIELKVFCAEKGIRLEFSPAHGQWANIVERQNQIIFQGTLSDMIHGGSYDYLWGWAARGAVEGSNRFPPAKSPPGHEGKTSKELWDGSRQPMMRQLRCQWPFLCLAISITPHVERRANFLPRGTPAVNLGYLPQYKSYALASLPDLSISRVPLDHVKFFPEDFPLRRQNPLSLEKALSGSVPSELASTMFKHAEGGDEATREYGFPPTKTRWVAKGMVKDEDVSTTRKSYVPSGVAMEAVLAAVEGTPFVLEELLTSVQIQDITPTGILDAVTGPGADRWLKSLKKDFQSLRDCKCFGPASTDLPNGVKAIAMRTLFKNKYSGPPCLFSALADEHFKARSLVQGFNMVKGLHYNDVFAAVVRIESIFMTFAWAVAKGLIVWYGDAKAAFYGSPMDVPGVWVRLPLGYNPDSDSLRSFQDPPLYAELLRAVPGIPQGSHVWREKVHSCLLGSGFSSSPVDTCVYLSNTCLSTVLNHVDDFLIICESEEEAKYIVGPKCLGKDMTIDKYGPAKEFLGLQLEVTYSPTVRTIFVSETKQVLAFLEETKMNNCNAAKTPGVPGFVWTKSDCPINEEEVFKMRQEGYFKEVYRSQVQSLAFFSGRTRKDTKFVLSKLAKFINNPGRAHFKALHHLIRYMKGTVEYGVEFKWTVEDQTPLDGPINLEGYSDSSFLDCPDTSRSTQAFVFTANGGVVSVHTKLGSTVDTCVNHSELGAFVSALGEEKDSLATNHGGIRALKLGARDAVWLRHMKAGLERRLESSIKPVTLYCDSSGVLSVIENPVHHSANKHIAHSLHEIRERVKEGKVKPTKIASGDNLADTLTKQLPITESMRKLIQLAHGKPRLHQERVLSMMCAGKANEEG